MLEEKETDGGQIGVIFESFVSAPVERPDLIVSHCP